MKTLLMLCIFMCGMVYSQTQKKIEWPSLAESPWPTIRGDMQGTGRSEYIGPKTANVVWRADLPLGIFFGPVIGYESKLFFGSLAAGSNLKNYFYAYNPNGTEYWNYETPTGYPNELGGLVAYDGTVYMLSNEVNLYVFSHLGELKWTAYVGDGYSEQISIDHAGNLYFAVKDTLKVLNSNGELLFAKFFEKISSDIVFSPDGNTLYFKSGNHQDGPSGYSYLNATDLEGNLIWNCKFYGSNAAPAAVDNQGNIYVYGDDSTDFRKEYMYSFSEDGAVRWKYPLGGFTQNSSPTIDNNGNIIFSGHSITTGYPSIVSLNHNGEFNWEYFLPGDDPYEEQPDHGLVCDAEGNIYFGSTWGTFFYALNKDGDLMWKLPLDELEYDSSPAIDSDGTLYLGTHKSTFFQSHTDNLIAIRDEAVSVDDQLNINSFNLSQNYPNPFNPTTKIKYSIPPAQNPLPGGARGGFITLMVYDILGNEIKLLLNEYKTAGSYEVEFDAANLSSGIYFYELKSGSFIETKKMILLR